MEKFFEVTAECKMHSDYYQYDEFLKLTSKVFKEISLEFGIQGTRYHPSIDALGIVPSKQDAERFVDELKLQPYPGGIRFFKKSSDIHREYVARCSAIGLRKDVHKPTLNDSLNLYGKGSYQLFEYKGKLYLSLELNHDFDDPAGCIPMKGSEFHKIMEEYEEKKKFM